MSKLSGNLSNLVKKLHYVTVSLMGTKVALDVNLALSSLIPNLQINSGDSNICYLGYAVPGTATSAALWQILEVDSTTGTIGLYADSNTNFDNVFDDRESLSYG